MDNTHIERLTEKSKYHDAGACIVRHSSAEKAQCKYAKNGYNITSSARTAHYNAPRYDAAKATELDLGLKSELVIVKTLNNRVTYTPVVQPAGQPVVKDLWDIGAHGNFVPLDGNGIGAHHPYKHNWHHLIANEMLFTELYDDTLPDPYQLLELLMAGGYNLNAGRNIVLLPQQHQVGQLVNWPIHPNNHPGFDKYAKAKIDTLKEKLEKALDNKTVHDVNPLTAGAIAEDLNKVSDKLYSILEQMPGGLHINKIQEEGARIEKAIENNIFSKRTSTT